ncbi:membrane protein [Aquitalea magnusonii]|nr:membrane protein [Aquitalea magnusonii]
MTHIKMTVRGYLVAGLLIWLPLGITLWVLSLIIGSLDQTLNLLPHEWQPEQLFGFSIPGLGVVFAFLMLLGTGMLAANVLGQRLVDFWHGLMSRTPFVKSIYSSVKQVSDTLLSDSGQAFKKALLVRWPHQDSWTVAFQTGSPAPLVVAQMGEEEHVSVYVPTTPNPTSGYFIMVPKRDTRELAMSVDDALKYVISMGVVVPAPAPDAQGGNKNQQA